LVPLFVISGGSRSAREGFIMIDPMIICVKTNTNKIYAEDRCPEVILK